MKLGTLAPSIQTVFIAAALLAWCFYAGSAFADTFAFTYSNDGRYYDFATNHYISGPPNSGSGVLTTTATALNGFGTITGISGSIGFAPISGLLAPGVVTNDNVLYYPKSLTPNGSTYLDDSGIGLTAGGSAVNIYFSDSSAFNAETLQGAVGAPSVWYISSNFNVTPIQVKSLSFIQLHQSLADQAVLQGKILNTFDKFGAVLGLFASSFIENALVTAQGFFDGLDTTWGKAIALGIGLAIGPAVAAYIAGGVTLEVAAGALLAATYALLGTYYATAAAIEQKIANDPPDSNYTEIYQPTPGIFPIDLGLGDATNAKFQDGVTALGNLLDDEQGLLTSMERFEGAELAGDQASADLQLNAEGLFDSKYQLDSATAADWFESMPGFLDPQLTAGGFGGVADLDTFFSDGAADLNGANVDVPEAPVIWVYGTGLLILGAFTFQRSRKQRA